MQFSKEVLKHSVSYDVSTLENILRIKTKEALGKRELEKDKNRKKLRELIELRKKFAVEVTIPVSNEVKPIERRKNIEIDKDIEITKPLFFKRATPFFPPVSRGIAPSVQPQFEFNNVKPIASNEFIDLGDLNPYLRDNSVSLLECNGPGMVIMVKRGRDMLRTDITLSKEDIDGIINAFSMATKIPVSEGVFRVAIGRVILTAQISEELGTKFVISKIF
jgi:hypothetical protein